MKTIIIVAMTRSRVIGKDGRIPWHDSDDLKHFKKATTGHAVIMGRKTFDSIGRPLPGRRNIVITRNAETPKRRNAETDAAAIPKPQSPIPNPPSAALDYVHSLDEALELCRRRSEERAFIIGGGQIYKQALPLADELIVTWIDHPEVIGDTFFPEWSAEEWESVAEADGSFPRAAVYRRWSP
jgi:dihydrofolate reductase